MGTAGQAGATALTGPCIHLLPPMACLSDEAVALPGKGLHAMADGQLSQPQQGGYGHLLGAGEAGLALATPLLAQALLALGLEA
jgi:hypothetical protein